MDQASHTQFRGFVEAVLDDGGDGARPWRGFVAIAPDAQMTLVTLPAVLLNGPTPPHAGDDIFFAAGDMPPASFGLCAVVAGSELVVAPRSEQTADPVLRWLRDRFSELSELRGSLVITAPDSRGRALARRSTIARLFGREATADELAPGMAERLPQWLSDEQMSNSVTAIRKSAPQFMPTGHHAGGGNIVLDPPAVPAVVQAFYFMGGNILAEALLPRTLPCPSLFRSFAAAHEVAHSYSASFGFPLTNERADRHRSEAFADAVAIISLVLDTDDERVASFGVMRALNILPGLADGDGVVPDGADVYCTSTTIEAALRRGRVLRAAGIDDLGSVLHAARDCVEETIHPEGVAALERFHAQCVTRFEDWHGPEELRRAVEATWHFIGFRDRRILAPYLSSLDAALDASAFLTAEPEAALDAERRDIEATVWGARPFGVVARARAALQRRDAHISSLLPPEVADQIRELRREELTRAMRGAQRVPRDDTVQAANETYESRGVLMPRAHNCLQPQFWAMSPAERLDLLVAIASDIDCNPDTTRSETSRYHLDATSSLACALVHDTRAAALMRAQSPALRGAVDILAGAYALQRAVADPSQTLRVARDILREYAPASQAEPVVAAEDNDGVQPGWRAA